MVRAESTVSAPWQVRWAAVLLAAVLLPAAVTDIRDALTRPFWADEVVTAAVANLGKPSAIWDALAHAADTQPPFFFFATALGKYVVNDEQLAFRLPALLGYYLVPFCLYLFVSRRVGVWGGLIAALTVVLSGFNGYAAEARPYGLELGCLALGMLCWQRVDDSRWFSLLMGVSLAGAVASHYYGVLTIPGFFLAEAVRTYRTRDIRYPVLAALVAVPVPFLIALPVMRSTRAFYGTHFWVGRSLQTLAYSYNLTGLGAVFTAGIIVTLLAVMLARVLTVLAPARDEVPVRSGGTPFPEEAALAAYLLCLPVVTFIAVTLAQGGLLLRYVLPTVLGLSVAAGFAVSALGRSVSLAALAVLVISHGFLAVTEARTVFHSQSRSPVQNSLSPQVEQMLRGISSPRTVVISSGTDYLPLAYYAPPDVRDRLTVLIDPAGALETLGTDSVDLELMALKPYLPINVQDFSQFRTTNQHFLLFSSGTSWDWWPARLSREGHVLKLRQERGAYRLYEVELMPEAPQRPVARRLDSDPR